MEHYKSWGALNKQMCLYLCDELKERVTFFLTRYHEVHNSYGRASIRLDGKELICFSWIEMYHQETDISNLSEENNENSYSELTAMMKPKWDMNCTYYERNFIDAVLQFRNMSIQDALQSKNFIIKILAIMDRRVGKRTLMRIADDKDYLNYPKWVQQFYELRLIKIKSL